MAPSLAVAGWGTPTGVRLDLRYAPEEADWLEPPPRDVWRRVVSTLAEFGAEAAGHYPVEDPYGAERGAAPVGRHFGVTLSPAQVTFGAGVTALLGALAALTAERTLLEPALVHPDLAAWVRARGSPVRVVEGPLSFDALQAAVATAAPAVVHVDRPAFGGEVATLGELAAIAAAAAARDGVVVVDEAPANYLAPHESAIALIPETENLIVLRGFTKAYSLGGMRVGFAVASRPVAEQVRAAIAPLQVGEVSFAVALRLLDLGDVCAPLRKRIHAVKPRAGQLLAGAGLRPALGHPDVPALVLADHDGTASRTLATCGIRGLAFGPPAIVHLRTPIGNDRIDALQALLEAGGLDA